MDPSKSDNFSPKADNFLPKSDIFLNMNVHPKICWFTHFVVNYCKSHLRTFCRQIHQNAKMCQNCQNAKIGGGIRPILAMPRFWQRLFLNPLPSENVYNEQDRSKNCRNYPDENFASYFDCEEHFVQEICKTYGVAPIWLFKDLKNVTRDPIYSPGISA